MESVVSPHPHDAPQVASLLATAGRVAAAHADLEELALHWDFLPLPVRHVVMRRMPDHRLRRLEQLLPAHVQEEPYDPELQAEWRRRCHAQGLHVDVAVSSDTLFRDAVAHQTVRDPRRVFWEHHFRSVLRADTSATSSTTAAAVVMPSGDHTELPAPDLPLYADVVEALKVNARELVPRNVARLLRLHRLRRVELHHPADHHKETLARGLESLLTQAPALQELGFFHGWLSAELLTRIAAALAKRQQLMTATESRLLPLQSVEFVSVKLKHKQDHAALVEFLSAAESVRSVRISSVVADFENRRLLDALLTVPELKYLSLEHNDLEDDAFAGLLVQQQHHKKPFALRHLRLGSNAISSATVQVLSTASRDGLLALERLELRNNQRIGDAGVHVLAPMLMTAHAARLTHLDVRNCHFGLDGAVSLLTALGENTALRSLDLSQNFLGSSVGDLLADFLLTNCTLERLHINYVGLGLAGCTERLQLALRTNQSLRVFSAGANRLRDHGAALLAQAIAVRGLTAPYEALDLSGNLITSDGLRELARVLDREGSDEGEEVTGRPTKRQRRVLPQHLDDGEERHARPVIDELGLLNNDLQGRGEAAIRTGDALEQLKRFVGTVHSNEWSSRRNVYDDEV